MHNMNDCNCSCGARFNGNTYISIVLDESSSMETCRDATISGFNEYIDTFRNRDDVFVTLTKFASDSRVIYRNVPARDVPRLNRSTYVPNGMTALFDAVVSSVNATESNVTDRDRALVLVLSDGAENASKEVTNKQTVSNMIRDREARGNWTFTYLGSNQDAWSSGMGLGFNKYNTITYTSTGTGTRNAFVAAAAATSNYLESSIGSASSFYGGYKNVDDIPDIAPMPFTTTNDNSASSSIVTITTSNDVATSSSSTVE